MIDERRLRRLEGERRLALPVGSAVVPNVIDFATGPRVPEPEAVPATGDVVEAGVLRQRALDGLRPTGC